MRLRGLLVFLSFFAAITLFYLRLPLNGSLFGDWDTWANLAMFIELRTWLESLVTGTDPGQFFYPYEHPWVAYGLDFFSGIIWVVYTWLGIDEFWAYWLCIVTILALNSYGAYLVTRSMIRAAWIRWSMALVLSTHFYLYLFLDWPNLVAVFPAFLCLHHLQGSNGLRRIGQVFIAGLWCALLLPLAPYGFIFFGVILGVLLVRSVPRGLPVRSVLAFAITVLPLAVVYLWLHDPLNDGGMMDAMSRYAGHRLYFFDLTSFARPSVHHELYRWGHTTSFHFMTMRDAFPGFGLAVLALWGLVRRPVALFMVALLLLVGLPDTITWGEGVALVNPLRWVSNALGLPLDLVRIPCRVGIALFMVLVVVAFDALGVLFRHRRVLGLAILACVLVESWAYEMPRSDVRSELHRLTRDPVSERVATVALHLPFGFGGATNDVRNYQYMILARSHRQTIVNGPSSYIPIDLVRLQQVMSDPSLPADSIRSILERWGVSEVVVHPTRAVSSSDSIQVRHVLGDPSAMSRKVDPAVVRMDVRALPGSTP